MRLCRGAMGSDSSSLRSSDGLGCPRRRVPAANDAGGPVTDGLSNGVTGVCCRDSAVKEGCTAVRSVRVNAFYANP